MNPFFRTLLGIFGLVYYFTATILCAVFIIIFGLLGLILAILGLRLFFMRLALYGLKSWTYLLAFHIHIVSHKKWNISGSNDLHSKNWYLLISNHVSWMDIPVLLYVFHHKTPPIKFFMKKELLWGLPVAGLACWMLGFPFMHRHTASQIRKKPELKQKDIAETETACEKFKIFPSTIVNFVEGTRFTHTKHAAQMSPYKHLLKPKAGGIALVLHALQHQLSGILDVTIQYDNPTLSFWQFICGDFSKITVHYQLIPITAEFIGDYNNDRSFRLFFQNWLNGLWKEKDIFLDAHEKQN